MSNEERVSWVALVVNVLVGFLYFTRILGMPADADLFGVRVASLALSLMVLAIAASIATHVALSVLQRARGGGTDAALRDERDTWIELRATRNSHWVLTVLIIAVLVQVALLEWVGRHGHPRHRLPGNILELLGTGPLQVMHVAQLLLAALTIAAITLNASRVYYYRRGV